MPLSVTVLYFASLREKKGRSEEVVAAPEGSRIRDLYRTLFPDDPGLPVAFARNSVYASPDEVVSAGDEIAFLPPVSGG